MTFDAWLQTLSLDTREDLDIWSAQQGWNAALKSMRLDLESRELLLKMRELPQHEDSCQWKEDGDGIWNTGCGHLFEFTSDGPTENQFRFCPYCGGKILICEETQE